MCKSRQMSQKELFTHLTINSKLDIAKHDINNYFTIVAKYAYDLNTIERICSLLSIPKPVPRPMLGGGFYLSRLILLHALP